MTGFILFFIGYFFLTFTLSKISENEEIDWDWLAWFFLLLPPVYFMYITRRFPLMIIAIVLTYWIVNFLLLKWVSLLFASFLFILPILLWFTFILHNLKADQKLNFFNLFPPVIWTVWLLIYLSFVHMPDEEDGMFEGLKEADIKKWNFIKKKTENNLSSQFQSLNKNLFKEFDKIDYQKVNNENYFWAK